MASPLNAGIEAKTDVDRRNIAVKKQSTEVARLLDELSIAASVAFENVGSLSERLRPVLRNEPASEELSGGFDAQTDLGAFLGTIITRINATNAVITDTRNRLEL